MTETTTRPKRRTRHATVVSAERLTPQMVRVVVGGDDLDGLEAGAFTDHYVKVQLPPPGAGYAAPFDAEAIKEQRPREQWPRTRSYTVRAWDAAAQPAHARLRRPRRRRRRRPVGRGGQAGRRPAAHGPRRRLHPGPRRRLAPDGRRPQRAPCDRRLPAARARRRPRPRARRARRRGRPPGADQPRRPARHVAARRRQRHRAARGGPRARVPRPGRCTPSSTARRRPSAPSAATSLVDREIPREALSVSGYWKRTRTDEEWRADKAEWNRLAEQDVA